MPSPYGRFDHRRGQGKPSPYKFGCGSATLGYSQVVGGGQSDRARAPLLEVQPGYSGTPFRGRRGADRQAYGR